MEYNFIGKDIVRKEAWEKVTGQTKYNADIISPANLYAVLVTSTCAHGNIKNIDTNLASMMPGVKAILTGADFPALTGSVLEDRPPLALAKVRYYGEPVAMVVARSEAEARAAAVNIAIQYENLPTVDSPSDAIKPWAPLVHQHMDQYKKVIPDIYPTPGSNVLHHQKIRKGDMIQGWLESEVVVEGDYTMPHSAHIAMETRNARAEILADGQIIIHTATQSPFAVRKQISDYFGIDMGQVVVHAPLVGGAFGGKAPVELEFLAVMASRAVGGQPVVIVSTREEDVATLPGKLGLQAHVKLGAKKDGTLVAGEYTFIVSTGAYADTGPRMTTSMAISCTGPYKVENVWCDAYCVYTNHTYATSFRGFGHSSASFAVERTMDKMAAALQMDPLAFRHQNAIQPGDTTPTQDTLTPSIAGDLRSCIDKVKTMLQWDEGTYKDVGHNRVRAKGAACLWKTSNSPTDAIASAVISFNSDGSVNLHVGAVEIGPSTKTTLAQILAERMKLDIGQVHVEMEVNTRTSPHLWKTVASMSTFMVGRAVQEAADDAIRQILSIGAMALKCAPEDLSPENGRVYVKDNPAVFLEYAALVHGYKYPGGNTVGSQIIGRGTFVMPYLTPLNRETGQGRPGPYYTPGVQALEIELNTVDYTYRILRAATVLDAGQVLNHKAAQGVVMGGMGMGLGLGSREQFIYDKQQRLQSTSLRTYKVMRIGEQPDYLVDWVETPNQAGPYNARGLAEHGIISIHAALVNALSRAAGMDLDQVPVTPEVIWNMAQENRG